MSDVEINQALYRCTREVLAIERFVLTADRMNDRFVSRYAAEEITQLQKFLRRERTQHKS